MRLRYESNRAGIRKLLAESDVRSGLAAAGQALKRAVENASPLGGPGRGFRESISVGQPDTEGDEASITVSSSDAFAHLVEFGSVNNPPYAPFRRGAESLGLRVEDSR